MHSPLQLLPPVVEIRCRYSCAMRGCYSSMRNGETLHELLLRSLFRSYRYKLLSSYFLFSLLIVLARSERNGKLPTKGRTQQNFNPSSGTSLPSIYLNSTSCCQCEQALSPDGPAMCNTGINTDREAGALLRPLVVFSQGNTSREDHLMHH